MGVLVVLTIDSVQKQTNRHGLAGEQPGEKEIIGILRSNGVTVVQSAKPREGANLAFGC